MIEKIFPILKYAFLFWFLIWLGDFILRRFGMEVPIIGDIGFIDVHLVFAFFGLLYFGLRHLKLSEEVIGFMFIVTAIAIMIGVIGGIVIIAGNIKSEEKKGNIGQEVVYQQVITLETFPFLDKETVGECKRAGGMPRFTHTKKYIGCK